MPGIYVYTECNLVPRTRIMTDNIQCLGSHSDML